VPGVNIRKFALDRVLSLPTPVLRLFCGGASAYQGGRTLDARLQLRMGEILRQKLKEAGRDKGSIVVLDPATGDLLAAVSYPLATANADDTHLDRARY